MCGIIGVTAKRNCIGILLEGLQRLEYRGYDSAGLAIITSKNELGVVKAEGKIEQLRKNASLNTLNGGVGIAHTRWATHGKPTLINAHPHVSQNIALVHNGIIENYRDLKESLIDNGYIFTSETDSEAVVHLMHYHYQCSKDMLLALELTLEELKGAFALSIINTDKPEYLYVARKGSPLVLGLGIEENFIASDQLALKPVTDKFIFLEDGDYGVISAEQISLRDVNGIEVERTSSIVKEDSFHSQKGSFKHFMLKEIYEQPAAIQATLDNKLSGDAIDFKYFNKGLQEILIEVDAIQIVACGTSYHAGLIAKHWFEEYLSIPVLIEVASEYRYRSAAVLPNSLFVSISQSGETADTLAALKKAKLLGYLSSLVICNVDNSSLVRESDFSILTKAGPEIGVASTKAFTTQLTSLLLLMAAYAQVKDKLSLVKMVVSNLRFLPNLCESILELDIALQQLSVEFVNKQNALFLGRGAQYAVAMEAALKLKEISYIHAEAYAAGELKHGPLALVDADMPVIAIAANNQVLSKIKANLEEVKARGGQLFVFVDENAGFDKNDNMTLIPVKSGPDLIAPILYSIPLQLLAYHVAVVKGTDIDQPRNLAKSVTVE